MSHPDVQNSESALAERVRWLRQQRGWTLEQAGRACVVATSSLSKIENGLSSPTYDVLLRIAKGFGVDVAELFVPAREHMGAGRRTIERAGTGELHETPMYEHRVLCSQLANKRMMPFITRIKAHAIEDDEGWSRHDGEEFVYVLKGSVELHTEFYQPAVLHTGDCFYIDSRMLHRVINHADIDAEVMWISTKPELCE
ncbi:XRE family transcriptional regulator [Paenalcaligenes niemegkensis]|uniref:helix-turn-helix domain-containing protein n=1 Tax=Paenalcaligenes niemegkensis TaxID=2895469 RepID=UPI001EE98F76|nr:XRE family transcriptional regulator [Paenalcaligenes niemegkensis]MCQ9615356.1 XRE family transcriptional regulator [Paenalcaligenes niemegkensis]